MNKPLWIAGLVVFGLPLFAMLLTNEVKWGAWDFAIFGVMIATGCCVYEIVSRSIASRTWRALAGVLLAVGFLLVWAELAVGVLH